jgi:NADH dehydrogenase [ubiquinone] 1 alpha subcomplex assembly factor 5
VAAALRERNGPDADPLTGGVRRLVQCDLSHPAVPAPPVDSNGLLTELVGSGMEEYGYEAQSVDLVLSSLALHWVNDIPGVLQKIRGVLRPDGAYIGCMLGGNTLQEMRHCFYLAEQERKGGRSVSVSVTVTVTVSV